MVVALAGPEGAADEVPGLERLVDRWRLVDAPGDRLEVADVEAERPQIAIPADDVERVVAVMVGSHPIGRSDLDDELTFLIPRLDLVGRVEVALRVGRMLEELPVVVAVSLRRLDLRGRLQIEHALG